MTAPLLNSFQGRIVIEYRKGFVRVVETWFDEPEQVVVGADVLRCIQRSEPAEDGTATPFYTLLLDMRERPETLLAKMNKETRYEIRRAEEKDGIECRIWETTDAVCRGGFSSFYNQFAAERGLAPLNLNKLQKFADQGELILSAAHSPAGKALVWHSYYRGHRRVRLLIQQPAHHLRITANALFSDVRIACCTGATCRSSVPPGSKPTTSGAGMKDTTPRRSRLTNSNRDSVEK